MRVAGGEAARAVDRVDHDDVIVVEPAQVVGGFFRQPGRIRDGGAEPFAQVAVHLEVGFGYRRAAMLVVDPRCGRAAMAEIAHGHFARDVSRLGEEGQNSL